MPHDAKPEVTTPVATTEPQAATEGAGGSRGGGKQSIAGEVAEHAARQNPKVPTLRLARTLLAQHPLLYGDVKQAESMVRYYRGTSGSSSRAKGKGKGRVPVLGTFGPEAATDWFAGLPEPIESLDVWEAVEIKGTRALLMSDIHVPYNDNDAVRLAIEDGLRFGIDCLILNGDIIDFYSISRWETDPRKRNLKGEINSTKQLFAVIRGLWPTLPIYYKLGNHEERYSHFMMKRAPELLGVDQFEFASVMGLKEFGITLIPSRCYGKFGKLPVLHGHEFGKSFTSPVSPARGYWMKALSTMIGGHYHRSSSHSMRNLQDVEYTTWSQGCLCHMHPEYAPVNNWNQGHALVERLDEAGSFDLFNKKIMRGKVYSA